MKRFVVLIALSLVFCLNALAQDAGQVLRLSVGYRTLKNTAQMSEEKRKEVEQLEAKAVAANSDRRYGDAIRHMSHGIALMRGQAWTPESELSAALQVKADRLILDPGAGIRLTLTQIYTPDAQVEGRLNGSMNLVQMRSGRQEVVSQIRNISDLSTDFSKSQLIEASIPEMPALVDGNYQLVLSLKPASGDPIVKTIGIRIASGLNARSTGLKTRVEAVRSDLGKKQKTGLLASMPAVEYGASMIDLINDGQLPVERTDVKTELDNANALLDKLAKGEDPLSTIRGDMHWAYRSAADQTLQPYRYFIPSNYDSMKKFPLIVALHGMGGDENSFFAAYNNGEIKRLAESRGYIVVCPKGRAPASMYLGTAERDVIDVIREMKRNYSIDEDRVYLMGHSMGGYGTWSVAVNNPDIFAALAPISGGGNPLVIAKLKGIANIPWIVTHGDKDPTVPVDESRKMVKAAQAIGIKVKYNEVPGGDHSSVVVPALKDIFDWFDAHKREPKGAVRAAGSNQ
ncbi:MAG: prolyl oligopeptidase family serine peptidase [Acidobacteria bacterium]|nr:prolyl oligopeptidase family serine peptidase [Acidobacteriota bacterium]